MRPFHDPSSLNVSGDVSGPPAPLSEPDEQQSAPETPPPPVGTTPPATLVRLAAEGRRGAAWRLFHWIGEDNRETVEAVRRFPHRQLLERFLEWLALGTWAGKSFKVPAAMRQPHFRTKVRTLFLPGPGAALELASQVLRAGLRDPQPAVRETAAHLLGIRGEAQTAPDLIAALQDGKPEVRAQAAKALGRLHLVTSAPALVGALSFHDEALASQVRQALLQLGPAAVPALLEGARAPDAWVRWHALQALGELHDVRGVPALVAALNDKDLAVAWMAARSLAGAGTPAIEGVLRLLINQPCTAWMMETAAYVLRMQHNQQLRPILEPVMHSMRDVDYRIAAPLAAQHALERLRQMSRAAGV